MENMKRIFAILTAVLIFAALVPVQAQELSGKTVRIMNCDTGRTIGSAQGDEFVYTESGDGFTLSDSDGSYIDLTGEAPKASAQPVGYTSRDVGNRTQIILPDGGILCDTGEGTDCYASLQGLKDSDRIYTGWYITEASERQPLKILPIGDSLTVGVNPDSKHLVSYREELSSAMIDYFGRVCFVGNNAEATALTDNSLLRHSGYSGYVIDNVYHLAETPGVAPLVDPMLEKYTPDIVLMMLGTNDCAFINGTTDTKGAVEQLLGRWEEFVLNIEAQLPENGIIICMTVPPMPSNPGCENRIDYYNEIMTARISELAEAGYKIGYADAYNTLNAAVEANLSSDGVHLSIEGYSAEATLLDCVLKQVYSPEGEKVGAALPGEVNAAQESEAIESDASAAATAKEDASPYTLIVIIVGAAAVIVSACVVVVILILRKDRK